MEQRMKLEFEGVRFSGTRVVMADHEFEFAKRQGKSARTSAKRSKPKRIQGG
jgi:hypothetical protein